MVRTTGAYNRFVRTTERKYRDQNIEKHVNTLGNNKWSQMGTSMFLIPSGTNPDERVGEKIYVHSFHARGYLSMFDTTGGTGSGQKTATVRMQLVLDQQANGVQAPPAEHLQKDDINAFRDLTKTKRFKVLLEKDIVVMMGDLYTYNGTTDVKVAGMKYFTCNYRFKKPLVVNIKGSTGAIAEVQSNNMYLVASASVGLVDAQLPGGGLIPRIELNAETRIRFTD